MKKVILNRIKIKINKSCIKISKSDLNHQKMYFCEITNFLKLTVEIEHKNCRNRSHIFYRELVGWRFARKYF